MVKHWPLKRGWANFNNELIKKDTHVEITKIRTSLGKCVMFEVQLFHTRFYIGWCYAKDKNK